HLRKILREMLWRTHLETLSTPTRNPLEISRKNHWDAGNVRVAHNEKKNRSGSSRHGAVHRRIYRERRAQVSHSAGADWKAEIMFERRGLGLHRVPTRTDLGG